MKGRWIIAILLLGLTAQFAFSQEAEQEGQTQTESQEQPPPAENEEPITGGVTYDPLKDETGRLRDPFKSPFEIEQEEEDQNASVGGGLDNMEQRLPHTISELTLKGIYLKTGDGYWAIFAIAGEYNWFREGTLFRDGDLVNITDGAVVFKHYVSEDATQVREVIKELHRSEE